MPDLESGIPNISPRDAVAALVRRLPSMLIVYAAVVITAGSYCFFWPPTYEAGVRFLVKHDRDEPVLSADSSGIRMLNKQIVSEDDLNSEIAIMESPVVLKRTVQDTNLENLPEHWLIRLINAPIVYVSGIYNEYHGKPGPDALTGAVDRLRRKLIVTLEKKSAILDARLRWGDPEYARLILEKLTANYVQHHIAVHRVADTQSFFLEQVNQKREELADLERHIETLRPGATLGPITLEKELLTKQASEFEFEWRRARVAQAQSAARVTGANSELMGLPIRIVTEEKPLVNQLAIGTLKGRILELELKREELRRKYQPTNPLVVQVEGELKKADGMLADEMNQTFSQKTTDVNRVAQTLQQDLAQNRAGLQSAVAFELAMRKEYQDYQARLDHYNAQSRTLQSLDRQRSIVEASLIQYQKQYEVARVEDAMNRTHMVNVAPIEPVWVEPVPVKPNSMLILKLAIGLGLLFAAGWAFLLEMLDRRVRTARDVELWLHVPVLATFDLYGKKELKAEETA